MALSIGDNIPAVDVSYVQHSEVETVSTADLFATRRSVLVGVPGAFTPTCNDVHAPGFILNAAMIKSKGVDRIVFLSVNDAFVVKAWAHALEGSEQLEFLADGLAEFTKALGLGVDISVAGLGLRCKRFAALIVDGRLQKISIEEGKGVETSSAETVLSWL